ncbi:MAG: DUF2779 domain-containing protein [Anaerolineae bacterium]|nr:DUF2779 domain-containing protein [Anaerolineae bacterium]
MGTLITKSDILAYLDAPLHLWAAKHEQLDMTAPSEYARLIMEQGQQVETMAKDFLKQFILPAFPGAVISFEDTFETGKFLARADALLYDPAAEVYDLFEIKSASSVKPEHLYDITFQRLVCEESLPIRDVYLVHLNKDYIRQGEIEIGQLFRLSKLTAESEEKRLEMLGIRDQAWQVCDQPSPAGVESCLKPKTCPCPQLCHPGLPDYPIYDIPRLHKSKARQLKDQGILAVKDIPPGFPLTPKQQPYKNAVVSGRIFIDHSSIQEELAGLSYPLYFLDYESYNPAVPMYEGYAPYQQIVFQYSLHVFETPDSPPQHYEFLEAERRDPSLGLLEHLDKHIGRSGSVIVWNKAFEAGRNQDMAARYPQYSGMLLNINQRIYDLMTIFSKGYYVHTEFHGSASIKKVLPVIDPDFDGQYAALEVSQGEEAMLAWHRLASTPLPPEERAEIIENLLAYCELDTLAMVKVWQALGKLAAPA